MNVADSAATPERWLISPVADAMFIIGTPLLLIACYVPIHLMIPPAALAAIVLAVVATSHHLPGFLRAYGDSGFYDRFRCRLLLAPPLMFLSLFWFTTHQVYGAMLFLAVWAHWHGFMQVYGFMRVYAAKNGDRSAFGARMDWLLCAAWFLAAFLSSAARSQDLRAAATAEGLPFVDKMFGPHVIVAVWTAAALITVVYAGHVLRAAFRGTHVSPASFLLVVSSCGFLYFCWVYLGTAGMLGVAGFELFHDLQYFAIVWASNRKLAESGGLRPSLRGLFQPRPMRIGLYAAIGLLYGSAVAAGGPINLQLSGFLPKSVIYAFAGTSSALHFYYDGFMWKVRQKKTQMDLGIARLGTTPDPAAPAPIPLRAELPQLVYLFAPLLLLAILPWLTHR